MPIRFGTYNTLNLFLTPRPADREKLVRQVVRAMNCDIIALQEIRSHHNIRRIVEFAESVDMTCYYESPWYSEDDASEGKIALGHSPHDYHVVLMWNPDRATPVPETFRSYDQDFFHGLIKGELVVCGDDGEQYSVGHASHHSGPFGNFGANEKEAQRVVSALTRPTAQRTVQTGSSAPVRAPWLIGADWNGVSADRVQDASGNWVYYDPDPYADKPWHDELIYQVAWQRDDSSDEPTRWWANRGAGEVLYTGGLRDAAPALHRALPGGVPWQTTVGHWPVGDPFGERRIDAIRVTKEVVPALRDYQVIDSDVARTASDHLPVVVSYDPARIDYSQLQVA